jgi:choline-phosphate cytidylyltransferase
MRIYTDGVFDLFHFGHANVFNQIKLKYPDCHLIIGVNSDEDTLKYKGPVVLTYEERVKNISSCKYIDEILSDVPWVITEEFMNKNNIDYIARESDPYVSKDIDDIYAIPKKLNKYLPIITYTSEISTSKIINRILNNYDLYYERNKVRNLL